MESNITAHWRLLTPAKNEQKAFKVLQWALKELHEDAFELKIEPYHQGGFMLSFSTAFSATSWPDAFFKALGLAQRIGRQWTLTCGITQELDACCNIPGVPGVTWLHVWCRPDQGFEHAPEEWNSPE